MTEIQLLDLDAVSVALIEANIDSYCAKHNVNVGNDGKLTSDMAELWKKFGIKVQAVPPWIGYLAIEPSTRIIAGTCAFKGNPNHEKSVEIAYFTFPGHEGRGFATAMARALIQIALSQPDAPHIIAHTLPQMNASTRVLQKAGMKFVGNVIDPDDGPVWRWPYEPSLQK